MARILRGMSEHKDAVGYVLLPTSSTGTGRHYAHTQRSRLGQLGWKGCDLESFGIDIGKGCRLLPCIQWYDSTHLCRTSYYVNWVFGGDEASVCTLQAQDHAADDCKHHPPSLTHPLGSQVEGDGSRNKRPPLPLVIRPGFIEDKFGQEQVRFWSLGYGGWTSSRCEAVAGGADVGGRTVLKRGGGGGGAAAAAAAGEGREMLGLFVQTWRTWLLDDEEVRPCAA